MNPSGRNTKKKLSTQHFKTHTFLVLLRIINRKIKYRKLIYKENHGDIFTSGHQWLSLAPERASFI